MRTKIFLATALTALLATSAAFAGNGNGPAKAQYSFLGQLTATPANGGVSITVQGGNRARSARCSVSPSRRRSPTARTPSS